MSLARNPKSSNPSQHQELLDIHNQGVLNYVKDNDISFDKKEDIKTKPFNKNMVPMTALVQKGHFHRLLNYK